MLIEGKVCIVTGSGQGIGKGIALKLAEFGCDVAVVGRTTEKVERVASEIEKMGRRALPVTTDVSDFYQVTKMTETVIRELGGIDILVNNAATTQLKKFVDTEPVEREEMIKINLGGYMNVCQAIVPHLIEKKGGKIINVASIVAFVGRVKLCIYAASKGGIISFSKALARELARYNINVNCVCPGPTDTPAYAVMPPREREIELKMIPLGRIGQPEDVGNAVVFLASPLSDFITGQTITVDGGMTMR